MQFLSGEIKRRACLTNQNKLLRGRMGWAGYRLTGLTIFLFKFPFLLNFPSRNSFNHATCNIKISCSEFWLHIFRITLLFILLFLTLLFCVSGSVVLKKTSSMFVHRSLLMHSNWPALLLLKPLLTTLKSMMDSKRNQKWLRVMTTI